ncbi:MAG: 30S ribosomal protein S1 [Pseudomonadales bacterium]|nr:30S ribosomal protein S1 [Pseudomonadales bacterium]NRA17298.1 30S ribosomal protein S1 [Oceanospirillaceae bacterium]
MSESFADLFAESLEDLNMTPGAIVAATVIAIEPDFIIVNANLKSEGVIPRSQFVDGNGELTVKVGDQVQVALEAVEDGFGATLLSREKAKRAEAWQVLEVAFQKGEIVEGVITGKVRGGFTVTVGSLQGFLPGSLLDMHPLRDTSHLEGCPLEFKLVKLDVKKNNVVLSRRAVLEDLNSVVRDKLLETLDQGQVLKGIVKNITDYGAFVDLGGLDGLLHITDIAWKRVKHPSVILSLGDEIEVKILKFDREKSRVSLGLKQLLPDPWTTQIEKLKVGEQTTATVTNLTDYGCFAQIVEGVEGLVHVSEMDWTNRNVHPSKVVQLGEEIQVMVLDIDTNNRRISLGMKQCIQNPWQIFSSKFKAGDKITGKIRSITDFGLFVSVGEGVDGLVHLSDLSWDLAGNEAVKAYRKGDDVETALISVDIEKERIALSIKQLNGDDFSSYTAINKKGAIVTATVIEIESNHAVLELATGVSAILKRTDASRDRIEDLNTVLKIAQSVEVMISQIDTRNRKIQVSIKQMEQQQEREALDSVKKKASEDLAPMTIGDLIKAQLDKKDK